MQIAYSVRVNKRAKRVILKFKDDELVIVSPKQITKATAEEIISNNYEWITKQVARLERVAASRVKLESGQTISILGTEVEIKFEQSPKLEVELRHPHLIVSNTKNHDQHLVKWLRKHAKKVLPVRVRAFASAFGFDLQNVSVRDQSTRWGSCSGDRNISINWRLIFAPTNVLDYVVVHELAHLDHMNHSEQFWEKVETMMPDYKKYRKWLKQHGDTLAIG